MFGTDLVVNESGDVVFLTESGAVEGLYFRETGTILLCEVVKVGDVVPVAMGDSGTVTDLDFRNDGLNNMGKLIFVLTFSGSFEGVSS